MPTTRSIAIAAALCAACAGAWYSWTYAWLPEGASTVSLLHAADTFKQCSRFAPFTRGPYWIPTARQVRQIEPALPAPALADAGTPFTHQYIGFTRAGKRLVYVNVAVNDWPLDRHAWQEYAAHFADRVLPERPAIICDGGAYAWGVVYDPATKKFEPPRLNGRG